MTWEHGKLEQKEGLVKEDNRNTIGDGVISVFLFCLYEIWRNVINSHLQKCEQLQRHKEDHIVMTVEAYPCQQRQSISCFLAFII